MYGINLVRNLCYASVRVPRRQGRKGSYRTEARKAGEWGCTCALALFYYPIFAGASAGKPMSDPSPAPTICYGLPPVLPNLPLRRKSYSLPPGGAVAVSVRLVSHRLRSGHAFVALDRGCGRDTAPDISARSATVAVSVPPLPVRGFRQHRPARSVAGPDLFSSHFSARCFLLLRHISRFDLQQIECRVSGFFVPYGPVRAIVLLSYILARRSRPSRPIPHLRPQVTGRGGMLCFAVSG